MLHPEHDLMAVHRLRDRRAAVPDQRAMSSIFTLDADSTETKLCLISRGVHSLAFSLEAWASQAAW